MKINGLYLLFVVAFFFEKAAAQNPSTCDSLFRPNGGVTAVDIQKVDDYEVVCTLCGDKTGAVLSYKTTFLTKVKFRDGTVRTFSAALESKPLNSMPKIAWKPLPKEARRANAPFKIWVNLPNEQIRSVGLYETGDSSIVVAKTNNSYPPNDVLTKTIPVEYIVGIQARKKGRIGKGILAGAGVGIVLGAVVGALTYKPPPPCPPKGFCLNLDFGPGFDAIGGVAIGLPIGILIGGLVGSARQTFIINGNQNRYAAQRDKLRQLGITGQ